MPYRLTAKESEAVSALPPDERLRHLVKRVADWEEVWSLREPNGWALSRGASGEVAAPFWPHPDYAQRCAAGEWAGCEPQTIALDAFFERWLPGLARDGRVAAVFPTPES